MNFAIILAFATIHIGHLTGPMHDIVLVKAQAADPGPRFPNERCLLCGCCIKQKPTTKEI